jgi:hypothetical protein
MVEKMATTKKIVKGINRTHDKKETYFKAKHKCKSNDL